MESCFQHDGWRNFNQDEIMDVYFKTLKDMNSNDKSDMIDLFLNSIEGKYSNSSFTFSRPRILKSFIKILIVDINTLLTNTDDLDSDITEMKIQRSDQLKRVMRYSFNSSNTPMGDLGIWVFDSSFWGNVSHLESENQNKMRIFLELFLDEYFDQYRQGNITSKDPNHFKADWHISFKNIHTNKVSAIIYSRWMERIFNQENTDDEKIAFRIKINC
jgi:hypothetical protein